MREKGPTTTPSFPLTAAEKTAVTTIHSVGSAVLLSIVSATIILFIALQ